MGTGRPAWVTQVGVAALSVLGLLLGLSELSGFAAGSKTSFGVMLALATIQVPTGLVVLALARRARVGPVRPPMVLALAVAAAGVIAYTAAAIWPNSGDEYGYVYVARTLLAGRAFNPAPPVAELFDFYWIGVHDGRSASQYSPGWPALLVPFLAAHVLPLANPLLLLALGAVLLQCLRRVAAPAPACAGLIALVMLAPFTLFNAASLFNHVLAATAVMGVCGLQLRDDGRPSAWNHAGIGFLLSVALVTRVEVFAITALPLGLDCLWRQRLRAFRTAAWIAAGALPLGLLWLGYNAVVTGHPFTTTQAWVAPEQLAFALPPLDQLVWRQAWFLSELLSFTGAPVLVLYAGALWMRMRAGRVRFFDLLFPAAIVFFFFYPADGGHQYGPRYWFFAWPTIALTIGAACGPEQGFARVGRMRLHLPTVAGLQAAAWLGFVICFTVFLRLYVDQRRMVYATRPPAVPAVVLVPDQTFRLSRWQQYPFGVSDKDLTRNDLDFNDPVLYGRGTEPRFAALACTLPGRHVYRWEPPGTFIPVTCP